LSEIIWRGSRMLTLSLAMVTLSLGPFKPIRAMQGCIG
jgi:hypothetical protein